MGLNTMNLHFSHWGLVSLAFAAVLGGCASLGYRPAQPVTVQEIVAMSREKVPAADILAKMRGSGTVYRLTASQLADLRQQGVANEVIDYMQQTYLDAVRRDQQWEDWNRWSWWDGYWYGGWPYRWGPRPWW
jgi:hypothetical protein